MNAARAKTPLDVTPTQFFKTRANELPAGIKTHMYPENADDYTNNYVTKWKGIFRGLGMNSGQSQQIIT